MEDIESKWTEIAKRQLVGRTITDVFYLSPKDAKELCGWDAGRPIVLRLDDGNMVYPSRDDEGNDAGALFTNDPDESVFPVLRDHLR